MIGWQERKQASGVLRLAGLNDSRGDSGVPVTLASGFLGSAATPLFFVGATLGNALGRALGIPIGLAAGVRLAALFATAANTPIALSTMAI
jgi:H+/Cl- antiporter ClcA